MPEPDFEYMLIPCYTKDTMTIRAGKYTNEVRMTDIAMKVGGTYDPNCITIEIDGQSRFVDAFALIDAIDKTVKRNRARRL
jgi:hypothetical protein